MICPMKLADDMSALRAARVENHLYETLYRGRGGGGDEATGNNIEGICGETHMDRGGGSFGDELPAFAAAANSVRGAWVLWAV